MIKWYRFRNFHSFLDDTYVDFTSGMKSSTSSFDFQIDERTKISKVSAILGANGSGKSNLMKPLAFLSWFMTSSFQDIKQDGKIPVVSYETNPDEPTTIEVEFCIPHFTDDGKSDAIECKYFVELDQNRVYKEELKLKTSRLYSRVFYREFDKAKNKYDVTLSKFMPDVTELLASKTPHNSSIISFLSRLDDTISPTEIKPSICSIVFIYFFNFESNLVVSGRYNEDIDKKLILIAEEYEKNPEIKESAFKIIKSFDMGLVDISVVEKTFIDKDGNEEKKLLPYGVHEHNGKRFILPFIHESSGTKAAYCTLFSLVSILMFGSVAILDELDNDLHPHLLIDIIDIFKNKETNKNNAQLIISTHTPEVLKHLKRHHCFIVEKANSTSEVWRLDDIEGLRSQDNLYVKYITGAIGGVPTIG